jgi:dTDP-glucose pyrophosphorylase
MKNIKNLKLSKYSTIKESLKIIDSGSAKIALVVDEHDKLIGTLTDGDIRRAILKGKTLDDTIETTYSEEPVVANVNDTKENIINLCTSQKIYQIPIVNSKGKVVSLDILDELIKPDKCSNKIFIMAGGLGTRLRPLTENIPKPMLNVGGKPILQTIVEKVASYGFTNIVMCVNYKSSIIQDFFGDGAKFSVKIEYLIEEKRMGTAGALSLLKERPSEDFFVMNGDLLTMVNFDHFMDFHLYNNSLASMCVKEYDFQVPYGVVDIDNGKISSIEEKPMQNFFVNAGIYLLNPTCIDLIPQNTFFDMTTLFQKLIVKGKKTLSFPLREYWIDIGVIDEYKKANIEYNQFFNIDA